MRWMIRKSKKDGAGGKAASARRPRRRGPVPKWLSLTGRISLVAAVVFFGIGLPVWLWQSGWVDRTAQSAWRFAMIESMRLGLAVQDVRLEGRQHTSRREIVKAIGVRRGAPILAFDLTAMRKRLEALPWVRTARIERRLPDMLRISLEERRPMALWQRHGRFVLVDEQGKPITNRHLGQFRNLVILVGKDAPREAPTLFAMIASEPDLARRVTAATRVGDRRWNLDLKGGVQILLPEKDPHRAWRRLAQLDVHHRILERDIKTIDMRLPDRLIVKPGALGTQAKHLKGQST